eukprot:c18357_g1_i1.p1 GENE.c18357_g1_i1~~c18357_g1_i1.p1  ORF type:complete len:211 (+),score=61.34 c18357_g1_i1:44-634(+)
MDKIEQKQATSTNEENQKTAQKQDPIRNSNLAIVPEDEKFIAGWILISINKWDQEQERILLLTSKAIYRVKYLFDTHQVDHFKRSSLTEITILQKGYIYGGTTNGTLYGMRLYQGNNNYQTFTTNSRSVEDGTHQKDFMITIINDIARTRRALSTQNFCISDYDITRSNSLGPLSTTYNKLGWGLWNTTPTSESAS